MVHTTVCQIIVWRAIWSCVAAATPEQEIALLRVSGYPALEAAKRLRTALLRLVDDATDGKLVDGAYSRSDGKLVVIVRDLEHHLLGPFVAHPLGQDAGFFGTPVPIFGVVEMWCNGHETRRFLGLLMNSRVEHVFGGCSAQPG